MKTLIIGKLGIGVTYFIKNTLIKKIEKALIFDLNEEYKHLNKYRVLPLHFNPNEMNDKISGMIALSDKEETIILDSFKAYLFPKRGSNGKLSYEWLNRILNGEKAILTLHSVAEVDELGIDEVEKIYLFDTIDDEKMRLDFKNKYQNIIEWPAMFTHSGT